MSYSRLEQEAIVLNAVWDMINGMVNFGLLCKFDAREDIELRFQTSSAMTLFNILLVDFLSHPRRGTFDLPNPPEDGRPSDRTYLFYVRRVCEAPILNSNAERLRKSVDAFGDWLDAECVVPNVWLRSIDENLAIRIRRTDSLKICGDIAKHNFARRGHNVRKICRILARNGRPIDEAQGFLVLPEFHEWFHHHLLSYHASTIAEFLNNIRWEIYLYLLPEYRRAYVKEDELRYRFDVPAGATSPLGREMYWAAMNRVRGRPSIEPFTVTQVLKSRY